MKSMYIPTSGVRALRAVFTGFIFASFALLARVDAAAPLAGTLIGNQASASYTDESGMARSVLSNTVVTEVLQVNAFTLVQNNNRSGNAGSQVFFPHTVTNIGNGPDTYGLTALDAGGDDFQFVTNSIKIYIDADGDGNPDNYTPITTTGVLAAGATFRFVVAATIPTGAAVGETGDVTVTATPVSGIAAIINTDTATVTTGAVMQVTKAASQSQGQPGTQFLYTITYRNTGLLPAEQLLITDVIPAGLTIGEAKWSVTGAAALSSGALPPTVAPNAIAYNQTGATVTFKIGSVAPGANGFVTVAVEVAAGQAPAVINNTATYDYDSSGFGAAQNTNTVPFEILPEVALTFTGPAGPFPTVAAGGSVLFANTLTNNGTGTDTFNVVVDQSGLGGAGKFPVGTTFQLLKSDQATPLTDTDSDGIADTGPVTAGGTYVVYLKAILPSGATTTADDLSVTKTATSKVDPTKTATATDTIDGITGAGVDLQNEDNSKGSGAGDNTVLDTKSGNPGSTVTFTINVHNTGPNPDTFDLLADKDGTFGTTNDLPPGYTLVFKSGGTVVTNTGVIGIGASKAITVEVIIPSGATPGLVDFYFQSKSPSTGVSDYLRDQVSVNTVRGITLQTNNSGQTFPGGSVVYQHTLTNVGNVVEGQTPAPGTSTLAIALADTLAGSGFTSVVYYDANNDGIIDGGDVIVPTSGGTAYLSDVKASGLGNGQSIRFLVKVQAPIGAADGASNITTLTVTPANVIDGVAAPAVVSNTDTTNVIRGNLTVVKEQKIVGGGGWVQSNLTAEPGQTIEYRITVTNVGSATAENVVVNDTIPVNTTYTTTPAYTFTIDGAPAVAPATFTPPADGAAAGTGLVITIGELAPAKVAVFTFAVKIDQ